MVSNSSFDYFVDEGINNCGHGERSSILNISIDPCNNLPYGFNIPNAFSPNGDGINDFFVIEGLPVNSTLTIFNRDGNKLFSSDIYQNNWDGKENDGHIIETGTYWFVLKIPGISEEIKGFVYLKR